MAEIDTLELKNKVAALQKSIHAAHPNMKVLLREIHTHLKNDPEQVTLLDEDEIGIIVNGLKKQTATEIVTQVAKKASNTKSLTAELKQKAKGGSVADLL